MEYKCIHKKFGIVLYRRDGDLLTSLSWALGSSNNTSVYLYEKFESSTSERKGILHKASLLVNSMIKEEVVRSAKTKALIEKNPEGLNIDDVISNIDEELWQFIENCTTSKRENEHKLNFLHVKKLRRFFIICLFQFCQNIEQPLPIHNILADVIQVSGSRLLLRVLNRLGCTSSPDTYMIGLLLHKQLDKEKSHYGIHYPSMCSPSFQ